MKLKLRNDAYTPDALEEAGVPGDVVRTLLADGPNAVPEKPLLSLTSRRRGELTTRYIWGPDAEVLLQDTSL